MTSSNLARAIATMALVHCSFGARAEVQTPKQGAPEMSRVAQEILQKWIASDMHFFIDTRGAARLFLRRQPVRAGIALGGFPMKEEINHLIARFSKAAGVSYELTSSEVNLAIVIGTPINVGDKPNPMLWKRVGLTEEMYNIASEEGSWASRCGIYSFSHNGQVDLSITFADSKLEPARVKDCVIDGIIRAFGLRVNRKSILISDNGYIQFVTLAKALSTCEQMIGPERLASMSESEQKSKYIECASNVLEN